MSFAKFMSGPVGRGVRILAGLVLIVIGIKMRHVGGAIVALVGLVPLFAGLTNVCVLAPLLRVPFNARKLKENR